MFATKMKLILLQGLVAVLCSCLLAPLRYLPRGADRRPLLRGGD